MRLVLMKLNMRPNYKSNFQNNQKIKKNMHMSKVDVSKYMIHSCELIASIFLV